MDRAAAFYAHQDGDVSAFPRFEDSGRCRRQLRLSGRTSTVLLGTDRHATAAI